MGSSSYCGIMRWLEAFKSSKNMPMWRLPSRQTDSKYRHIPLARCAAGSTFFCRKFLTSTTSFVRQFPAVAGPQLCTCVSPPASHQMYPSNPGAGSSPGCNHVHLPTSLWQDLKSTQSAPKTPRIHSPVLPASTAHVPSQMPRHAMPSSNPPATYPPYPRSHRACCLQARTLLRAGYPASGPAQGNLTGRAHATVPPHAPVQHSGATAHPLPAAGLSSLPLPQGPLRDLSPHHHCHGVH